MRTLAFSMIIGGLLLLIAFTAFVWYGDMERGIYLTQSTFQLETRGKASALWSFILWSWVAAGFCIFVAGLLNLEKEGPKDPLDKVTAYSHYVPRSQKRSWLRFLFPGIVAWPRNFGLTRRR